MEFKKKLPMSSAMRPGGEGTVAPPKPGGKPVSRPPGFGATKLPDELKQTGAGQSKPGKMPKISGPPKIGPPKFPRSLK